MRIRADDRRRRAASAAGPFTFAAAGGLVLALGACAGSDSAVGHESGAAQALGAAPASKPAAPATRGGPAAQPGGAMLALRIAASTPARASERLVDTALRDDLDGESANLPFGQLSFAELHDLLTPRDDESPEAYFQRQLMTRPFVPTAVDAVSTFALEADTASYALARARVEAGALPDPASVRAEEFVNYLDDDTPPPVRGDFAVSTDLCPSPYGAPGSWILRVGLRARDVLEFEREPVALTFVVDRSGSMGSPERMPMVKRVLELLSEQLDARDQVAVVIYSDEAELLFPPTRGDELARRMDAVRAIEPGGSTNVEAGLALGCDVAAAGFLAGAQNFVVLLSDGLGNVGETEADALLGRTESARARGLRLNTVGVGMGVRDRFLERLANAGDGRCDYVDREEEARRAFVERFSGAFQVVATDAKLQVELDPALVGRWRLIGYENRALADADFADDTVDAGEIGAGHSVAALYELEDVVFDGERPLGEVRLRYLPHGATAHLEAHWPVSLSGLYPDPAAAPHGLRGQIAMAQLAELLADSAHAADDPVEALVADARALAASWGDADFAGVVEVAAAAAPLVERRRAAREPVLDAARALAFAHYQHLLEARRDPASPAATAAAELVAAREADFRAAVDAASSPRTESAPPGTGAVPAAQGRGGRGR